MTGEVISVSKTGYHVNIGDQVHFCLVNNSFKSNEKPVVGDVVQVENREDKYFLIDIKPRKSLISRYDKNKKRHQQIAANVDVMFIVTSANKEFSINRIKRFLRLIEGQDVKLVLVITKGIMPQVNIDIEQLCVDSLDTKDVRKLFNYWAKGQTALLIGSSGVGKTTIVNSLSGLGLKTREIMGERRNNQGRHTTSARTMYYLEGNRKIIDCPGIKFVGTEEPETFD